MKYGIAVKVTEEFLGQFVSKRLMKDHSTLCYIMKKLIMCNWNLPLANAEFIQCDVKYNIDNDMYIFRLKSVNPYLHVAFANFVAVDEGCEYPQVDWFGK
jgi:hypothetical protein